MADTEKFPEEFAQWMLLATASPSSELVQKRWEATSETASRIEDSPRDVLTCARLMFGLPVNQQAEQAFRKSFVQSDPSFAGGGNKLEMKLLAGATLASVMRSDGAAAGIAVLAVLSGSACGARVDKQSKPFVELAQHQRRRLAMVDDTNEAWPTLGTETAAAIESGTVSAPEMNKVAAYVGEVADFGARVYKRLREEASIAWWVLGEYSIDFDKPVKDISPKAVPITLAKELADLTQTEVGPASAPAVLWRMLKLPKKLPEIISFGDSVEGLPTDWLGSWITDDDEIDALTPVMLAARSRHKSDGGYWRTGYPQSVGLTADPECNPLQLSTQVYFECLLVEALSKEAADSEE